MSRFLRLYRLEYSAVNLSSNAPLARESIVQNLDRFSSYDSRIERQLGILHNRLRDLYFRRRDLSVTSCSDND